MNSKKVRVRPQWRNQADAAKVEAEAAIDLVALEATERQALATLMVVVYSNPVVAAAWRAHADAIDAVWRAKDAMARAVKRL